MSFLQPKFVLLAFMSASIPALWASGCTGGAFSSSEPAGPAEVAGSGGTGNSGGSSGTGAGTSVTCAGPEDCNDKDVCTVDRCNADGTCAASPKCMGNEKCCEGDCAQCCDNADCDDGISCTENRCFMGQCMYLPEDASCGPGQYCAAKDGCHPLQACGILANEDVSKVCDDGSTCTVDSCEKNFCRHEFCSDKAKLCCEGGDPSCAEECCVDSQCDTDQDPCSVGKCEGGKCSLVKLCGEGQQCCPSADGKTATCGGCCSAKDCNDDITCTEDQCGGGRCSNTPKSSLLCPRGEICSLAQRRCVKAPDCVTNSDCKAKATGCQTNPVCDRGTCRFDDCAPGSKCCGDPSGSTARCGVCCDASDCGDMVDCTTDTCTANGCVHTPSDACKPGFCDTRRGCLECRSDTDCDDRKPCTTDACNQQTNTCIHLPSCPTGYCDETTGGCVQCRTDSDCQGGGQTRAIPIIGTSCLISVCVGGVCANKKQFCASDETCCPPYGCASACFQL